MTTTTPVVAEVQPDKRLEKRTGRRFSASEELRQKNGVRFTYRKVMEIIHL